MIGVKPDGAGVLGDWGSPRRGRAGEGDRVMSATDGSEVFRSDRRLFMNTVLAAGTALFSGTAATVAADENSAEHPLQAALREVREAHRLVRKMSSYECTFTKKEVVDDDLISQKMKLKIRHDPFSVYMLFQEPREGREVIFVTGQNDNKLLVHETGLAALIGTLSLSPEDSRVKAENRYPITKAGMANMVQGVIEQWEAETKYGECDVKYFSDAKVEDYTCRVIESSHPQPRKQFPFQMTRLWIDEKTQLAVRVQQFGFPKKKDAKPPVIEDYLFTDVQPDLRFTDRDFDTDNPAYNF